MNKPTTITAGVITFTNVNNYGAVLQAYALVRKIKDLGCDAKLINYFKGHPGKVINLYNALDEAFLRIKSGDFQDLQYKYQSYRGKLFGARKNLVKKTPKARHLSERGRKFQEFVLTIPATTERYDRDTILKRPPCFDVFITGSDQVWNYRRSNDLDAFLLRFAPDNSRKISYAASFGIDHVPFFLRNQYRSGLERLNHISVREDTGVKLVQSIAHRQAEHVVDPTLLLDANDWAPLMSSIELPAKYVLVYTLTISKNILVNAKATAAKLGARVVWLRAYTPSSIPDDSIVVSSVGPREFLYLINDAIFIITDSFHGTAFSLTFGKKFLYIGAKYNKQVSRARSLLNSLGLCDRLQDDDVLSENEIMGDIDYARVNSLLAARRRSSLCFLEHSLGF